jgi:hypothetical protein
VLKERVKNVLNFKKRSRVIVVAAVVLAAFLTVGFAVDRAGAHREINFKIGEEILISGLDPSGAFDDGAGSDAVNWKMGVVENNTSNLLSATFKEYSGTETKNVKIKANETLTVDYALESKTGGIAFSVKNEDETLFTAASGDSGTATFAPKEDAIYVLVLKLSKATDGNFRITWNTDVSDNG